MYVIIEWKSTRDLNDTQCKSKYYIKAKMYFYYNRDTMDGTIHRFFLFCVDVVIRVSEVVLSLDMLNMERIYFEYVHNELS